jgi:two-component system, OmpR family, response regulator
MPFEMAIVLEITKSTDMIREKKLIFFADDDQAFLKAVEIDFAGDDTFSIQTFPNGEELIEHLGSDPDIVVLDYHLNGFDKSAMNGRKTMAAIKVENPLIPVIILSFQENVDIAISCVQNGAFDYIVKGDMAFSRLRKTLSGLLLTERSINVKNN